MHASRSLSTSARRAPRAAVTAFALAAAAAATAAPLALPHDAAAATSGRRPAATVKRSAPATEVLLTFRERPGLHAFVKSVSDPASTRYREYATIEQLAARYGAAPRERRAVAAWASANGLSVRVAPTGTFAIARGSAAAVAAAVGAGSLARASSSGADASVPVPAALRGSVGGAALLQDDDLSTSTDPTQPATAPAPAPSRTPGARSAQTPAPTPTTPDQVLTQFFGSAAERTGTPAGCEDGANAGETLTYAGGPAPLPIPLRGYTPNQYTTAYGHAEMHRRGFRGEGMRVAVLETDGFKLSDVRTFASCFGLSLPTITRKVAGIRSFPADGDETTLDLEFLIAAAPRLKAIDVVATAASARNLVKGALKTLGTPTTRPDVISISLGICEPALAGDVLAMRAMADVYAVAAGAGISTFVATGDSGVTGCARIFGPSMIPAVSAPSVFPSVTAVGGTNIALDAQNRLASQRTWNNAPGGISGGGGGLSIVFESPWYQGGNSRGAGGRAVPDIAALGDPYPGYAFYCTADIADCQGASPAGGWQSIGGTSAATPLMAAGVLLAAQEARSLGQPPLGLINPLIYALGGGKSPSKSFSDVTLGSNDTGTAVPAAAGGGRPLGEYSAEKGYDLATGWGSLKISGFSQEAVKVARRQAAKADGDDRRVATER